MGTRKIFKIKPSVIYRWLRKRRYFPYAVILACAVFFLPAGIIGGVKISHFLTTNRALAATRALAPEHSILEAFSERERAAYASVLSSLVLENPEKITQLIGQDFLVMFSEPDLQRTEGAVSIWQYRTNSCILDIYFAADSGEAGPAAHYEVRQRKTAFFTSKSEGEQAIDVAACLRTIYDQRRA